MRIANDFRTRLDAVPAVVYLQPQEWSDEEGNAPMAEVIVEKATQKVRDMYGKGAQALERGSLDYAIDMFMNCVRLEPRLLQARRLLRVAEIRRFKESKGGTLAHLLARIKGFPQYLGVEAALRSGKTPRALEGVEELMKIDPLNRGFVKLFARVANAADLPEAAIQTLEIVREVSQQDLSMLNLLGTLYIGAGRTKDARKCLEEVVARAPNDPKALKALKDVLALDSMQSDGWSMAAEKGSYRDLIKDTKEAQLLEQQAKAVKTDQDADALIADMEGQIQKDPRNINYYRALARLQASKNDFARAAEALSRAMEINPGDPELDAARSQIRVQQFDHEIGLLRKAGQEPEAEAQEHARAQFIFDDLQERVKRYPNDLRLRYELGVTLLENDYCTEAIQQFQLAQRSPKHRTLSLYHLAMCFKNKKQLDMAMEQLKKADSELPLMDGTKKDVMYEIGVIAEAMNDRATAAEYFKRIYQSDIGYKDISQKIEHFYQQKG
jgi:tetratricopeptide (TPR) repeat protein